MISEKTIATFFEEYNRDCKKSDTAALEMTLHRSAEFLKEEPVFVALCSTILQHMRFENTLSGILFCMGIYSECRRRQEESEDLSNTTQ